MSYGDFFLLDSDTNDWCNINVKWGFDIGEVAFVGFIAEVDTFNLAIELDVVQFWKLRML